MQEEPECNLWTVDETMYILRTSRNTIYKYIREGKMQAVRVGDRTFFRKTDVEAMIKPLTKLGPSRCGFPKGNAGYHMKKNKTKAEKEVVQSEEEE